MIFMTVFVNHSSNSMTSGVLHIGMGTETRYLIGLGAKL